MGPISNRVSHEAAVDEVEFVMVRPICFDVVNLEAYVWRYPVSVGGIS